MTAIKGFIENTAKEVANVMFNKGISGIVFIPKNGVDRYDADEAISNLYREIAHDVGVLNTNKFKKILNDTFESIERV
jgi:hypothetical protein